jgi:subtilisin-like proprotein convertase family protein
MKVPLTILALGLLAASWLRADGLFSQTFTGGAIPDNPVGAVFGGDFTAADSNDQIVGVTVDLNITGGIASGFYVYLIAPDNSMTVLLSQPGVTMENSFGNLSSGLDIRLADGGTTITASSDLNIGTGSPYQAAETLSNFGTLDNPGGSADGNWDLYLAELTNDGETPTLNSWSLNVTVQSSAVPEPCSVALLGLSGITLITWRKYLRQTLKIKKRHRGL